VSLTISIYRPRLDTIDNDQQLPSLNLTHVYWYLISSNEFAMSNMSTTSLITTNVTLHHNPTTHTQTLPLIKALPTIIVLSSIVILCLCGNILVILSVFTFRPLRTVQNFFIVSLAFSDMLVAIIVMPFHIVTHIVKRWTFGKIRQRTIHRQS
jgi:hypothetical protein